MFKIMWSETLLDVCMESPELFIKEKMLLTTVYIHKLHLRTFFVLLSWIFLSFEPHLFSNL